MTIVIDRAALVAAMQQTSVNHAANLRQVTVPGWGVVCVRKLSVADVDDQAVARRALQAAEPEPADGQPADPDQRADRYRLARSAIYLLCDQAGQRLFDPRSKDDLDLIASQPWALLRQVMDAAEQVNATGDAAVKNG